MTDKIIKLTVKSSGSSVTVQSLNNMQLLDKDYNNAYISIDKFIGYQNGILNNGLYLHMSSIDECYINDITLITSPAQICQNVDIFDGVINSTNTGYKYSICNNTDTWLPIKMDRLNNITFDCYGIMNPVNYNDLNFILTVKIKFCK